ncbi:MAG TPA: hypothetical protein VD837_20145 [Terriglobales bacterium]|nr:hypothetical protein [Terriglobales bacterium]
MISINGVIKLAGHASARRWIQKAGLAVVDQGLLSGSNFLLAVFLGRYLVPQVYGAYALAYSIFLFTTGIYMNVLTEPMGVLGPARYRGRFRAYLGTVLYLHFAVTALLSLGLIVAGYFAKTVVGNQHLAMALYGASIATIFFPLLGLGRRFAYLNFRPSLAVRGTVIYSFLLVGTLVLLKQGGHLGPLTAFLAQALAATCGAVTMLATRSNRASESSSDSDLRLATVSRGHWDYGRWAIASTGAQWLSTGAYYVIVSAILGMKGSAELRILQNFIMPTNQFFAAMSVLLIPRASADFADHKEKSFGRTIASMHVLFITTSLGYLAVISVFGRQILQFVYAGRYTEIAYLIPIAALPVLLNAISQPFSVGLRAMQAPSQVFYGNAVAAGVTMSMGALLTLHWGLPGVLVGLLLSSVAYNVVLARRYKAKCNASFRAGRMPMTAEESAPAA